MKEVRERERMSKGMEKEVEEGNTIGPWAWAYGRVLEGGGFLHGQIKYVQREWRRI